MLTFYDSIVMMNNDNKWITPDPIEVAEIMSNGQWRAGRARPWKDDPPKLAGTPDRFAGTAQ